MGRISALTELTSLASDDYLVVLDSSANIAKKITIANAFGIPDLGYTATGESWTYASATTITVPTDATTKYQRGNIIKITQATGGTKYGVIRVVAATLLTIEWLNSATLVNEAITSPFYTTSATPLGAGGIAHEQLSTNSDWAWDTYTPTWANLTIGNGTTVARYKQIGKQVHVEVYIIFGTTTSISGLPTLSLPVVANTRYATGSHQRLGYAYLTDEGTAVLEGSLNWQASSTNPSLYALKSDGTYAVWSGVSSTIPHTWANTDKISLTFDYEAA